MARGLTPDDLIRIKLAGDPQLSPDGRKVAFVMAQVNAEKNETHHRIYMMDASPGAKAVPFTGGSKSDKSPRWSPDGAFLAFLSDRSGKNQLWVMPAFGGEARQLTRFKEGVSGAPVWSPDGTQIAFTAEIGPDGPGDESAKDDENDLFKKYTKGVKRITRISYKVDGTGFLDPEAREQVFVVGVAEEKPEPRQVTRGTWNHSGPAWSPDGKALAFIANRRQDDDYSPFLSDLWVADLTQPEADPVRLTPDGMGVGTAAWSPDGRRIAFLGEAWEPYRGYSSTRLWVVGRDGAGLAQVTDWDRTFGSQAVYDMPAPGSGNLRWTPDGEALIALGSDSGRQQVMAVDLTAGTVTALTQGEHCVTSWSFDASCRKCAVGMTRPDVPADVFLVEGPDLLRLTDVNVQLFAEVDLAPVEAFSFATSSATNAYLQKHGTAGLGQADGWVMKPVGFEEGRRYPAILEIHGGPMAMYGWTFFMEFQCLAAAGYAVVYTNPRGSQGYGQHFCACIKEDWGNLDYHDVMAGLDAALAAHPWLDPEQLGIAGGSYGGFMTNWVLGHESRFKAGVTMRSVVNEASSVGTSDFGFVDMLSYPTRPWEDMTFYRRVSPLTFVANIHTPLLIEHQEEDYRCPMEQAEQLYSALKTLRRPVEFIRYPESSHGMSRTGKPWLRVYRLRSIVDWFGRHIAH